MPEQAFRTAVLISGHGSNLEAILQAQEAGTLGRARVVLVISNKADALGLARAEKRRIPTQVIDRKALGSEEAFQTALISALTGARVELVCLAGFLRKLGPEIIEKFRGRILNIHPALLPRHGGSGMYGLRVHEAVIQAHDLESGCSVHLVDEEFDHGATIAEARVPVLPTDTPEQLAARVLEQEHVLYPRAIARFCEELNS